MKNTLPSKIDKRGALLLPLLTYDRSFQAGRTDSDRLLHFSTIIGFIGMLRPHTFAQLRPSSINLVTYTGRCKKMPENKFRFKIALKEAKARGGILGFYITFQSKTSEGSKGTRRYPGFLYYLPEQNYAKRRKPTSLACAQGQVVHTAKGSLHICSIFVY